MDDQNCTVYAKNIPILDSNIATLLHMLEAPRCISGRSRSFSQMLSAEGSALASHGWHCSICLAWLPQLMRSHLTRACSHDYDLAFYTTEFQLISKYCRHPILAVCCPTAVFCYSDSHFVLSVNCISSLLQLNPRSFMEILKTTRLFEECCHYLLFSLVLPTSPDSISNSQIPFWLIISYLTLYQLHYWNPKFLL